MTNQNYEIYKKTFGENPAKLIRGNYPESPDNLKFLDYISKKCKTKTNAKNVLKNIENLLYVKNTYLNDKENNDGTKNKETLDDVLEKVGYEYKIINNVKELNYYKKYYSPGEVICKYNNPNGRLNDYHMIVLSKKDLDKIKRSKNPKREDEYSTSLLNIQIHKRFKNVSIKSRYNHTIDNPDAVHSNNLDKISEGLTGAIEKELSIKIDRKSGIGIPDNLKLAGDFIIHYWIERNNVYIGEDVYVDNDRVNWIDPNKELIADQFLINFKEKTVRDLLGTDKSFLQEDLEKALKENKLQIKKIK
jgi:hypothetical protein